MRQLLKEQIDVLKSTMDDRVKRGDYYDLLVDLVEGDLDGLLAYLTQAGISSEKTRAMCACACSYIRAVAEARDETVIELLEEESLP
jgi:hypothetical protein